MMGVKCKNIYSIKILSLKNYNFIYHIMYEYFDAVDLCSNRVCDVLYKYKYKYK
ncbi:hypothetical protein XBFM1_2330027 [Xenorhabdus bovienii str. feltiae Moldova]|uniref:Uncharacterized protein n=1 Tax=Xenorhabdus bovienii str. feltiae Moldova TaxID=1398200 RepID=A0A077NTF8_XENBV|nr:hypothetical protein XBFM1_2330027 [Xenorhabdus bovienii str. feltiae Moldova]